MCVGVYDNDGRPTVTCKLVVHEDDITSSGVPFLIDTGADVTLLSPHAIAASLGYRPDRLRRESSEERIGGVNDNGTVYVLDKSIEFVFSEFCDQEYREKYHIEEMEKIRYFGQGANPGYSILGNDFLKRFTTEFKPQQEEIDMRRRTDIKTGMFSSIPVREED